MSLLREFLARRLERKFVFFLVAIVSIAVVLLSTVTTSVVRSVLAHSYETRVVPRLELAARLVESEGLEGPGLLRVRQLLSVLLLDPDMTSIVLRPSDGSMPPLALAGALPAGIDFPVASGSGAGPLLLYPHSGSDNFLAWSSSCKRGTLFAVFTKSGTEQALSAMNSRMLQAAALICIVSCFMGLFMARLILRPIERFITAMRQIAEGQEVRQLQTLERNELGDWTSTFNSMIGQLRTKHNLEKFLLAREKNDLVAHIAAGLAHRIRTPLTAINSLTQLITRGGDRRKLEEWTSVILGKVKELDDAVSQFVTYAQPVPLQFGPGRPSEVVSFALELVAPDLASKGVLVDRPPAPADEREQMMDSQQLQQAFLQLFRYAFRAMEANPEGAPRTLRVTLRPMGTRPGALIQVDDTGEPVPEELRQRVFEPFVDMTNRYVGIGLPVAARLLELHGGSIRLVAEAGWGNSYLLELPSLTLQELQMRNSQASG